MANNTKIITEDVLEIKDPKIITTAAHPGLGVVLGETYDSVLTKIAAQTASFNEKAALDAAVAPSGVNPYVTLSELSSQIQTTIPWKTIGTVGSGSDFEGSNQTPFVAAFASGGIWFRVREGTYTFTATLTVPDGFLVTGVSAESTVIQGNIVGGLLSVGEGCYLSFLKITQQAAATSAVVVTGDSTTLEYVVVTATLTGQTIAATGRTGLKFFNCGLLVAPLVLTTCTSSYLHGLYVNAPTVAGVSLDGCDNVSLTSSIFAAGLFRTLNTNTDLRAVANHFNDSVALSVGTTIVMRANTPNNFNNNNEDEDFVAILSYIGSPSIATVDPPFTNNYGGPPGEDLTARTGALDLLVQWRYEERNFQLMAATEPTTISWAPSTNLISSTGPLRLLSSHRSSYWTIPTLTAVNIPANNALYYVLDRTLAGSPIVLTPVVAPLGSIPNDRDNRQVYVLAFALGTTLWWRGGDGSRFPGTGGQTGTYFVDGSSKSLLDYMGASDYNDSDPSYTNNFAGVNGDSLTVRANALDVLTRRLFEASNLGVQISDGGYLSTEPGLGATYKLSLVGTLTFAFPSSGSIAVVGPLDWSLADGDILYFTLNQSALTFTSSTVSAFGSLPLPDNYPAATKYFCVARRVGTSLFLWDDSEHPVGGRYPIPTGRSVVPRVAPATLADNTVWDGSDLLWESLAVAVATGQSVDCNRFPNQTVASPGLTALAEGEGIVVTHTWNTVSTPQNVTLAKVTLLNSVLKQNQFIWAERRNGYIIFR